MLFNSIEYLLFLPIIFIFYWFVLNKNLNLQNTLLLISSYIFYGWWDWRFLLLIVFSSFIDYFSGLNIEKSKTINKRKQWLMISIITNLGFLGVFKYYNFFSSSFSKSMALLGWEVNDLTLKIILPVGISFYTFQTLSYSIDIYRKTLHPSRNIISFFTYVSFFPQLVAGPIVRASDFLPQINKKRLFNEKTFNEGIIQIFIGLFRKVVVADNLAIYVDSIYSSSNLHNSTTLVIATVFYSFQIYFDFSGYSDIAIGSAKLFGFKFNQNFNFPYFSKSITEFWRRWHMSLSFWLRDYLYISLGGNRKGAKRTYQNIMVTMLLGGLWHGSSWKFVIWGGIHGIALNIEKYIYSIKKIKAPPIIGILYTYTIVLLSWIFFRSSNITQAKLIIKEIFNCNFSTPFIGNVNTVVIAVLMLFIAILFDFVLYKKGKKVETLGGGCQLFKW